MSPEMARLAADPETRAALFARSNLPALTAPAGPFRPIHRLAFDPAVRARLLAAQPCAEIADPVADPGEGRRAVPDGAVGVREIAGLFGLSSRAAGALIRRLGLRARRLTGRGRPMVFRMGELNRALAAQETGATNG